MKVIDFGVVKGLEVIYGDGIHDDYEALQKWIDGTVDLVYPDGRPFTGTVNLMHTWGEKEINLESGRH